ncbi:MAG TPA: hypothetical protein VG890_04845 [Puia sp.]|nr:hypothetical protein [Puia sp.]
MPALLSIDPMSSYFILMLFSYSILPAAVIACFRYSKVPADNRLFFLIVWVALFNEILSDIFAVTFGSSAVNGNIYVLVEAILYCLLFYRWQVQRRRKYVFWSLIGLLLVAWISDNLILHTVVQTNSLFRIVYSFILVFLALDQINQLITGERENLLKNARFLVSVGVVIFFTYKAIIELLFWLLPFSKGFQFSIYILMDCVNLLVNLIFALAALWIPTKQKFILPS